MANANASLKPTNSSGNDAPADSLRANPLRIGISTRALFDLEEEHRVFEDQGVKAYAAMQLDREDVILGQGAGFEVVVRLLALNDPETAGYVEVILLSQNSPDLSPLLPIRAQKKATATSNGWPQRVLRRWGNFVSEWEKGLPTLISVIGCSMARKP